MFICDTTDPTNHEVWFYNNYLNFIHLDNDQRLKIDSVS
jgi:hypothetical protein